MSNLMAGLYTRVELRNALITPKDVLLLIRDYHERLKELEEANARLKEPACDRSGACGLSDEDTPAS